MRVRAVPGGQPAGRPAEARRTGGAAPQARDEHELYFRGHPRTDREYLLRVFDELADYPATKTCSASTTRSRAPNWLSGDAAGELLEFFQRIEPKTGQCSSTTSPTRGWDTRFLGDLYQDLSETARKKYALLQTPEFVEEFILDRTLDPAIEEFGLEK